MQPSFLTMMDSLQTNTTTPPNPDSTPPIITDPTRDTTNSTQLNLLDIYQGDSSSSPRNTSTSDSSETTNDGTSTTQRPSSPTFTVDQLNQPLDRFRASTPPNVPTSLPLPADDSITNLIRLETAASNGLSLKFDGIPNMFPSWIRKFRLHVQLTHWSSAIKLTYTLPTGILKTYDITLTSRSFQSHQQSNRALDQQ